MIVIGIDPDADKYGYATYVDGVLLRLDRLSVVELAYDIATHRESDSAAVFVIEDVVANRFMYSRRGIKNAAVATKIAQNVGQCKHAQIVAEQFVAHYGFPIIRQPPVSGNWAKNKTQFERVTAWSGRSNEDTRSAAFLAFLNLKNATKLALK